MAQLVIEQPGIPATTVPLSGERITFGRADDNDVVLVTEEVSRHHAAVSTRRGRHVIEDLDSLNGTYVNRQRIKERLLDHMDEIWLGGQCRLVYRDDTAFGQRLERGRPQSRLAQDLDRIRREMESAASSLTMIGEQPQAPPTLITTPADAAQGAARGAAQGAAVQGPTPAQGPIPGGVTPDELVAMSHAYRRLEALYKAGRLIASEFGLQKRLSAVLDTAIEVTRAERGFVLLCEENEEGGTQAGRLRVSVAREMSQDLEASSPSMGIAGKAAIDGEPVLMASAMNDDNFGARESIIRQQITSAMCVPLKIEDRVLGSIYVDSRRPDVTFDEKDLELFASLASQSALAIENVRLYEGMLEAEKKRANLGRFLSPAIVEEVMKEDSAIELGGRKKIVTTLFCDIRGFTPLTERMSPGEMVELLNEHFTAMTEIVFKYKGTLDKYIGDEIMAVFGAPVPVENDAWSAVQAALEIMAKNRELNALRAQDKRPVLELGIGVNSGEAIAGRLGSPMRMEFTVVGDSVNTARRLCDIAKPGQVIVGGDTHSSVSGMVKARAIGNVSLEGKAIPVEAYEVVGLKG